MKNKYLIGIIILEILTICGIWFFIFIRQPHHDALTIANDTDNVVYVYLSNNELSLTDEPLKLFDTLQSKEIIAPSYRIGKRNIKDMQIPDFAYKGIPIYIFFISEFTLKNYSWNEIIQQKKVEKEMILQIDDIKQIDYYLIYK